MAHRLIREIALSSLSQMGQSKGRLAIKNSMTPSRAFFTSLMSVLICMLGMMGKAQDATGWATFQPPLDIFCSCLQQRDAHGNRSVGYERTPAFLARLDYRRSGLYFDSLSVNKDFHFVPGDGSYAKVVSFVLWQLRRRESER